jgi:hypothetical protein
MTAKKEGGGLKAFLCNGGKDVLAARLMDAFTEAADDMPVEFAIVFDLPCGCGTKRFVYGSGSPDETGALFRAAVEHLAADRIIDEPAEAPRAGRYNDA